MRAEREAAAEEAERTAKRRGRQLWWTLRLFVLWPLLAAAIWTFWRIGYESGWLAAYHQFH